MFTRPILPHLTLSLPPCANLPNSPKISLRHSPDKPKTSRGGSQKSQRQNTINNLVAHAPGNNLTIDLPCQDGPATDVQRRKNSHDESNAERHKSPVTHSRPRSRRHGHNTTSHEFTYEVSRTAYTIVTTVNTTWQLSAACYEPSHQDCHRRHQGYPIDSDR